MLIFMCAKMAESLIWYKMCSENRGDRIIGEMG